MAREAAAARLAREAQVAEAKSGPINVGHTYLFKGQHCYLDWVVVLVNESRELAFVVPRDHAYLEIGVLDVKDDTSVMRCNYGHFVPFELLRAQAELVEVWLPGDDDTAIQEARTLVDGLFRFDLPAPTEEQEYISETDEYRRRMRRIERCFTRMVEGREALWA